MKKYNWIELIDDPHKRKKTNQHPQKANRISEGNPPQANPIYIRPSPSSPAFPHVLGLYFTEFSRTICVWPRILSPWQAKARQTSPPLGSKEKQAAKLNDVEETMLVS